MNFTELLKSEMKMAYKTTENLLALVDADKLDWKPSQENNWMTMGQLLKHISDACGGGFKGFVTGDWGTPADVDVSKLLPEEMLPPAAKLPTVDSLDQAKKLFEDDKKLAYEMLEKCNEDDLNNKIITAPWDPTEKIMGSQMLMIVTHLTQHKCQLFYYLKLQGKPVNTGHLWGA